MLHERIDQHTFPYCLEVHTRVDFNYAISAPVIIGVNSGLHHLIKCQIGKYNDLTDWSLSSLY